MKHYSCNGTLRLRLDVKANLLHVFLHHDNWHPRYTDIRMPEDCRELVQELAPSQFPLEITKRVHAEVFKNPETAGHWNVVTSTQVYNVWMETTALEWKLDKDPLNSARLYLSKQPDCTVLDAGSEEGVVSLGFLTLGPLKQVKAAKKIPQEMVVDATCMSFLSILQCAQRADEWMLPHLQTVPTLPTLNSTPA